MLNLAAPLAAIVFAVVLSSVLLLRRRLQPVDGVQLDVGATGSETESIISIVNRAIPLYVAALAVAIGFKMNLFNIGVEGQYRIAALVAAAFGVVGQPPGAAARAAHPDRGHGRRGGVGAASRPC